MTAQCISRMDRGSAWAAPRGPRAGARGGAVFGFTLPEVLATMVLIGIVMPVVMRGVSVALATSGHARNMAQAAQLGEAKLSEMVALQTWAQSGASGDFGSEWPQYRWQCRTQSMDFNSYELRLEVTWTERSIEQSLVLSTIVFDNVNTTTDTGTTGTSSTGSTR